MKFNVFAVISILLISTINSPILFSSIAFSEEQQQTTTTEQTQTSTQTTSGTTQTTSEPTTSTTTPTTTSETTQTTGTTQTTTTETSGTTATQTTSETTSPTTTEPPKTETTSETVVQPIRPPVCPPSPTPVACGENQGLSTKFDDKGCVTGYECIKTESVEVGQVSVCPSVPPSTITCQNNEQLNKITDDKGCVVAYNCILVAQQVATPISEKEVTPTQPSCPSVSEKPKCDGNIVPVFDRGCLVAYSCMPSGCRQETDSNGFARVVCQQERKCPADQQQAELKSQCYSQGGNPVPFQDQSGCTFYDCKFDNRGINTNPLSGHRECPDEEETKQVINKCQASGAEPSIVIEGGCKIVRCEQKAIDERSCKFVPGPERVRIENECSSKGLRAISATDNNGCQYFRCAEDQQTTCQRNVPPEAYKSCDAKGGEMIVKTDQQGCVVFSNCVMRGDAKDAFVSPVTEVPDTTVLLSLALKLEQLKIELKKLATESNEIAKYYASIGSLDEERYNRVSSMFDAAANRIDEIKSKIKAHAESMTADDMIEIKRDIKYIKEVTLKDILYLMLSNSDDVKETLESSKKISTKSSIEEITQNAIDCGTDGMCFDRAIRSCKPITFQPEGRQGPIISITGLKDKNCVLHITMQSSDKIPPGFSKDTFFMDCPIADYALGVKGPEDILPVCEGPMAKFAKQFGGGEVTGGARFPPPEGGPSGCKTEKDCSIYCIDNYDECKQWIKEHPAYGPMPTKEELKQFASGKQQSIQGPTQPATKFSGPGGCQGPQECDKFCRNNPNVCINWCEENPGICPEEKLSQVPEAKVPNEFNNEKEFLQNVRKIGPVTTIDFETLPDGTPLYNGMKLSGKEYSSIGVTFYTPSEDYLKAFGPYESGPYESFKPIGTLSLSPGLGPFESGSATDDDLDIVFTTPVNAVGFYMLDLDKPNSRESVTFFDEKGKIIKTMSLNTFVGFISPSVGISKVRILENANDADDVAYDNLHFVKMGESGGRCDCTWAAGSPEHPRGCPVLCSDYSYDEASCEAQAINGCAWLSGVEGIRAPQPMEQPAPTVQACVGCFNNGVCDVGECSECIDCLKGTRSITGEIARYVG